MVSFRSVLFILICFVVTSLQVFAEQCAATTKKGAQCKRQAAAGSQYCWQHGSSVKNNSSVTSKSSESSSTHKETSIGSTATGKTLYQGPRGGVYHYSKSGKKVYQRKKR
ncbi:MAG: hypothetical protein Q8L88_02325 [Bacteroidota bacterium]|nr:hypothetical protein [Bacteroidota bacterium]